LALRLAITQLAPESALALIRQADDAGLLHPGAVEGGAQAWSRITAGTPQALEAVEAALRGAASSAQRRLGLALLAALGERQGWTARRHACLRIYREDKAAPWVSDAAELMMPPLPLDEAA
jgi:hypothetical protein